MRTTMYRCADCKSLKHASIQGQKLLDFGDLVKFHVQCSTNNVDGIAQVQRYKVTTRRLFLVHLRATSIQVILRCGKQYYESVEGYIAPKQVL